MFRGLGGSSRVVLLVSVCVVSACGAASSGDSSSNTAAPVEVPTPAPTPTPTPAVTQTQVSGALDDSIGAGVDAYGYADLPLRAGGHRYFVNSSTGSDSNGCSNAQQPGTALRTI